MKRLMRWVAGVMISALLVAGCDIFNSKDSEGISDRQQFSYQVFDEEDKMVLEVDNNRAGDMELEISMALFGEHFLPETMVQLIEERWEQRLEQNQDLEMPDFRRPQIHLHAENAIGDDILHASLHFQMHNMEQWEPGVYETHAITVEQWLELARLSPFGPGGNMTVFRGGGGPDMTVGYREYGFGIGFQRSVYQTLAGHLELQTVGGDHLEGSFDLELAAMRKLARNEPFPDDPEVQRYRIVGDFVAEYGDFDDLQQARINMFEHLIDGETQVNEH